MKLHYAMKSKSVLYIIFIAFIPTNHEVDDNNLWQIQLCAIYSSTFIGASPHMHLDHSCNEYCNLIGPHRYSKSHRVLVNSHRVHVLVYPHRVPVIFPPGIIQYCCYVL